MKIRVQSRPGVTRESNLKVLFLFAWAWGLVSGALSFFFFLYEVCFLYCIIFFFNIKALRKEKEKKRK